MKHTLIRLAALLLAPLASPTAADASKPEKRPNVLFILTDDMGWGDARFNGHPYVKTPSLNRFASQSTWFKQAYVSAPVCSPSRATFMTSRFPTTLQIPTVIGTHEANQKSNVIDFLSPNDPTITKLMKQAGYATAHFGKWHLGLAKSGAPKITEYGIDESMTLGANGPDFPSEVRRDPYFRAKSTGIIVDKTIEFIRKQKGVPFYVNLWTLLPHEPLNPTPEQLAPYADMVPDAKNPAFGPWMQKYLGQTSDLKSRMQTFCASLTDLDTQLGRLFAVLDEMNLTENTIIVFASDNGPEDSLTGKYRPEKPGVGNTGPLRARKRSLYEGGIRTFQLVRWPGHFAAGRVDDTSVVASADYLPSICNLCGVQVPDTLKTDGEDISDVWLGKARPRTRPLLWEWLFSVKGDLKDNLPPPLAIRDGDWKLMIQHNGAGAKLYNIPADIAEERNVAAEYPDVVKKLTGTVLAWIKTLPPNPTRDAAIVTGKLPELSSPEE